MSLDPSVGFCLLGFIIANVTYPWSKLLAGTFALGAISCLVGRQFRTLSALSSREIGAALICFSLALLSHEGILFGFVPFIFVALRHTNISEYLQLCRKHWLIIMASALPLIVWNLSYHVIEKPTGELPNTKPRSE